MTSNPFTLPAGMYQKLILDMTRKANLSIVQFGKNAQPSPYALNVMGALNAEALYRQTLTFGGYAALTDTPFASYPGPTVHMRRQYINLGGKLVKIDAPDGSGERIFDFTGFAAGQYAIVIQWKEAAVVPSTVTGSPPTALAGVTNAVNKPSGTTLYRNGDPTNTQTAQSDNPLTVGTTVQALRVGQVQYSIQIMTDSSLVGTQPAGTTSGISATQASVYAANPDDPTGYTLRADDQSASQSVQTIDGYYYCAKLMLVRVVSSTELVVMNAENVVVLGGTIYGGQLPMAVALTNSKLNKSLSDLTARVTIAETAIYTNATNLTTHVNDVLDAHLASAIGTPSLAIDLNDPALVVGNQSVQDALNRVYTQLLLVKASTTKGRAFYLNDSPFAGGNVTYRLFKDRGINGAGPDVAQWDVDKTVGPSGSGADIVWTAMDNMNAPTGPIFVLLDCEQESYGFRDAKLIITDPGVADLSAASVVATLRRGSSGYAAYTSSTNGGSFVGSNPADLHNSRATGIVVKTDANKKFKVRFVSGSFDVGGNAHWVAMWLRGFIPA